MKKVLFLTNYPSPYRVRFFDMLGKQMEVTVLFSDRVEKKSHRSKDWFESSQGAYHHVQLQKRVASHGDKDLCLDVLRWLKQPFDHIVICGYSSPTAILAIFYLRLHRIPFFLEADGGLIREDGGLKYRVKRMLVSSASGWLTTGKQTSRFLMHYGAKPEGIREYPFSSMSEQELPEKIPAYEEKIALRKKLGMEEEHIVLSIGQFIHRKGYDVLMEAAARLPENVGIYIVGGMPTEEYRALHEKLGLQHLHFSGFMRREQLQDYYGASDLFVLPTREDIWGLVIQEAMAFGLPVVTTDRCVAGLELVQDGVSGYIVPTEDPETLARRLMDVLEGDCGAMGREARKTARGYTLEAMVKAHVDYLG